MSTKQATSYPRPTGHCFNHHIPKSVVDLEDADFPSDEHKEAALKYLRDQKADLVKGDLIVFDALAGYRNDGVVIFTGDDISDLTEDPDEYGTLPSLFRVIEDGVPLDYWEYKDDSDTGRGIAHNSYCWFNHGLVRDQLLQRIKYEPIRIGNKTVYAMHTWFEFGGKRYEVFYSFMDEVEPGKFNEETLEITDQVALRDCLASFTKMLSSQELLPFNRCNEYYGGIDEGENVLFVDPPQANNVVGAASSLPPVIIGGNNLPKPWAPSTIDDLYDSSRNQPGTLYVTPFDPNRSLYRVIKHGFIVEAKGDNIVAIGKAEVGGEMLPLTSQDREAAIALGLVKE